MKYETEYRGGLEPHDQVAIDALMKSLALEDSRVPRKLHVTWRRSDLKEKPDDIVASMFLSDTATHASVRIPQQQLHDPAQFDENRRLFHRSLRKLYLNLADEMLVRLDEPFANSDLQEASRE